ncbi:TPA: hypothetical protein ACSTJY_003289 [Serratia fonticola]
MRKLTIMGRAIYFMTENDTYPPPHYDDTDSFCAWHDEEGQYWLDVFYKNEWRRANPEPFADFEEVFEAVKSYDYVIPMKR